MDFNRTELFFYHYYMVIYVLSLTRITMNYSLIFHELFFLRISAYWLAPKVLRDRRKRVTPTPKLIGVGAFNTPSRMACQILFQSIELKSDIDAASI